MSWEKEVEELQRREALAKAMGGEERIQRQHDNGRLTVRERIDALVDHTIEHAPHPIGINGPIAVKRCWSDRQNTGKWILHFDLSVSGHAKT